MREILFRGKRVDNGEWVEGCYIKGVMAKYKNSYILPDNVNQKGCDPLDGFKVHPETVGQFTGRLDKNGNKIFQGDKFDADQFSDDYGSFYLIEWDNDLSKFSVNVYGHEMSHGEGSQEVYSDEISRIDHNVVDVADLEDDYIIGNIHDNPELL